MELPGDVWRPFIGLVNQTTFAPLGNLMPWKMSRGNVDPASAGVDTAHNAVPGFDTEFSAKRASTGKFENASFDGSFNLYGNNPNLALAAAFNAATFLLSLKEGMYFRLLIMPAFVVAGPLGIGDVIGLPILGATTAGAPIELLTGLPTSLLFTSRNPGAAGTPGVPAAPAGLTTLCNYVMLACRVQKIHHGMEAAQGQPFDFDWKTVWPYCVPGEPLNQINGYGFINAMNTPTVPGGFF